MSDPIERNGNWEYTTRDGKSFKRRVGTSKWETFDSAPVGAAIELKLVRQSQAGQADHWLLFVSEEGKRGAVYQVKGDATNMRHGHATNVDVINSTSFRDAFVLATLSEKDAERIHHWAYKESPPSAVNQAAVKETCQAWVIRVLGRLVDDGIVQQRQLDRVKAMKTSIY